MADMFNFFLEVGASMFSFMASANVIGQMSILDMVIAFFVLYLIVDNFIIKPSRSSSVKGKGSKPSKADKAPEGKGGK